MATADAGQPAGAGDEQKAQGAFARPGFGLGEGVELEAPDEVVAEDTELLPGAVGTLWSLPAHGATERIRLTPRVTRNDGGHRMYGEAYAKRLGFIRRSRELGFTLDQVRTLLRLVDGGRYTCAQVKRIALHHLDDVLRKVADLRPPRDLPA